jgi:hypothetical protein
MKILLALAHYYRAEENSIHSSTSEAHRAERSAAIRNVIETWRGHLGPTSVLNVHQRRFDRVEPVEDQLDITVLLRGADHLLDRAYCDRLQVRPVQVKADDPRFIPFAAHRLFADHVDRYDMFIFSEDDLRPVDGYLVTKVLGFIEAFGQNHLCLPNRFEWNRAGPTRKTYIDGDLRPTIIEKYLQAVPGEPVLRQKIPGREIVYRRAGNPHAGFFALTRDQLKVWMSKPHFLDNDCSFIRPLESAATLGVLKTFPIYKSFGRDSGWLEIEHLDQRYSGLDLPREPVGGDSAAAR